MAGPDKQQKNIHPADNNDRSDANASTTRRQALKGIAYAAAVAPAMTVLLNGKANAQGNGNGNGNGPNCDNPGLHLGFNRNGHSAC